MTDFDPVTDELSGQSYSTAVEDATGKRASDLSVYGVAIEKDGKRIDPEHFYDTRTDEQVLAEAMGTCWHEYKDYGSVMTDRGIMNSCKKCGLPYRENLTFTTPAELWNLLMYMVGREDLREFDDYITNKFLEYCWRIGSINYLKWLITATYQDKGKEKLLFVKLCADWCREHEEVKA